MGRGPALGVKRGPYHMLSRTETRRYLKTYEALPYGKRLKWLKKHSFTSAHPVWWRRRLSAKPVLHEAKPSVEKPAEKPTIATPAFSLDFL